MFPYGEHLLLVEPHHPKGSVPIQPLSAGEIIAEEAQHWYNMFIHILLLTCTIYRVLQWREGGVSLSMLINSYCYCYFYLLIFHMHAMLCPPLPCHMGDPLANGGMCVPVWRASSSG